MDLNNEHGPQRVLVRIWHRLHRVLDGLDHEPCQAFQGFGLNLNKFLMDLTSMTENISNFWVNSLNFDGLKLSESYFAQTRTVLFAQLQSLRQSTRGAVPQKGTVFIA